MKVTVNWREAVYLFWSFTWPAASIAISITLAVACFAWFSYGVFSLDMIATLIAFKLSFWALAGVAVVASLGTYWFVQAWLKTTFSSWRPGTDRTDHDFVSDAPNVAIPQRISLR